MGGILSVNFSRRRKRPENFLETSARVVRRLNVQIEEKQRASSLSDFQDNRASLYQILVLRLGNRLGLQVQRFLLSTIDDHLLVSDKTPRTAILATIHPCVLASSFHINSFRNSPSPLKVLLMLL